MYFYILRYNGNNNGVNNKDLEGHIEILFDGIKYVSVTT